MKLSRITKVNPREVWKHEAHDFTQWLVKKDNIELLAEELELSLDNVVAEAAYSRCPSSVDWDIHQYSETGRLSGVSGNVDLNYSSTLLKLSFFN